MISNKLIQLLLLFTTKDWTNFEKLLKSGFIKKMSHDEELLFKKLQILNKRNKLSNFDKNVIGTKLFPKKPKGTIDKTMSPLKEKIEKYFAFVEVMNDGVLSNKLVVQKLKKGEDQSLVSKYEHRIVEEINKLPKDVTYYYLQFKFKQSTYYNPIQSKQVSPATALLTEVQLNLENYTILENLQLGAELATRKFFMNEIVHDLRWIGYIRKYINETDKELTPLIRLYADIIGVIEFQNDELYFDIEQRVYNIIMTVDKKNQLPLIQFLLNYAWVQLYKGTKSFSKKIFEIYIFGDAKDLFLEKDKIEGHLFCNGVDIAISFNEFSWASAFITKYSSHILSEDLAPIYLANASLAFAKKQFYKAIDILKESRKDQDVYFKIKCRSLRLKTYFELYLIDEMKHDSIKALEDSFKKYLDRNIKNNTLELRNRKFISFVKKMLDGVSNPNKILDKDKLRTAIKAEKNLSEKTWLLQKLEEL